MDWNELEVNEMASSESGSDAEDDAHHIANGYLPSYMNFSLMADLEADSPDRLSTEESNVSDYDTTQSACHGYLGTMSNVTSKEMYAGDEVVTMLGVLTNTFVFPGYTLPLLLHGQEEVRVVNTYMTTNNFFVLLVYGDERLRTIATYAMLMEMYELQAHDSNADHFTLKAKARQRCKLRNQQGIVHLAGDLYKVCVKILPVPRDESPLNATDLRSLRWRRSFHMPNYLTDEFNKNESDAMLVEGSNTTPLTVDSRQAQQKRIHYYRRYHKAQFAQAGWLFDLHETVYLAGLLRKKLLVHYMAVILPTEPAQLSNWFMQNFPLRTCERLTLLMTLNTVHQLRIQLRMLRKRERIICCRSCKTSIAQHMNVCPMSPDGIKSNYCNPGGHVYETLTVSVATNYTLIGRSSTQFSWFPGYAWTIMECSNCGSHLGWMFTSAELRPHKFFGLAQRNLDVIFAGEQSDVTGEHRESDSDDNVTVTISA